MEIQEQVSIALLARSLQSTLDLPYHDEIRYCKVGLWDGRCIGLVYVCCQGAPCADIHQLLEAKQQ